MANVWPTLWKLNEIKSFLIIKKEKLLIGESYSTVFSFWDKERKSWVSWLGQINPKPEYKPEFVSAKIEDVEEIKSGMQTANFIELKRMIDAGKMDPLEEHLCLSIVFKNNIRTIDLIAPNETVQRKWQRTLQTLIETSSQYREIKQDFDQFLLQRFQQSDRDRNGVITFDEALSMLSKLNILFDEHEVKMLFEVRQT